MKDKKAKKVKKVKKSRYEEEALLWACHLGSEASCLDGSEYRPEANFKRLVKAYGPPVSKDGARWCGLASFLQHENDLLSRKLETLQTEKSVELAKARRGEREWKGLFLVFGGRDRLLSALESLKKPGGSTSA